jgi:hypothetical protein
MLKSGAVQRYIHINAALLLNILHRHEMAQKKRDVSAPQFCIFIWCAQRAKRPPDYTLVRKI